MCARLLESPQHHYSLLSNEFLVVVHAKYSVIPYGVRPCLLILEETKPPWSEGTVLGQQRGTFPLPRPPTCCSSSQMHVYDGVHSGLDFPLWSSLSATSGHFFSHTDIYTYHTHIHSPLMVTGRNSQTNPCFTDTDRILTQATFIKNGCSFSSQLYRVTARKEQYRSAESPMTRGGSVIGSEMTYCQIKVKEECGLARS